MASSSSSSASIAKKLSIHHVVQDDVHQERRSVPGALDVPLHDVLNAIQKPAIFGIALADGNQKVVADKQIDLADQKVFYLNSQRC